MFQFLLLVHRYLGILIGWLVALWCLTGFVMMYVQYPELGEDEYRAGLTGLDLERCCHIEDESLGEHYEADRFTV